MERPDELAGRGDELAGPVFDQTRGRAGTVLAARGAGSPFSPPARAPPTRRARQPSYVRISRDRRPTDELVKAPPTAQERQVEVLHETSYTLLHVTGVHDGSHIV